MKCIWEPIAYSTSCANTWEQDYTATTSKIVCPSCTKTWEYVTYPMMIIGGIRDAFCNQECRDKGPTEGGCTHIWCRTISSTKDKRYVGPRMDKITEQIYIGSSQDAQHRKRELKQAGITAILNVARDLTNSTITHKDFEMYHIGIMDGGGNNSAMASASLLVLSALVDDNHKVLVHCHEGKSRSAGLLAAYLTKRGDFDSMEEAIAYLKSKRPRVDPNDNIIKLFTEAAGLQGQ